MQVVLFGCKSNIKLLAWNITDLDWNITDPDLQTSRSSDQAKWIQKKNGLPTCLINPHQNRVCCWWTGPFTWQIFPDSCFLWPIDLLIKLSQNYNCINLCLACTAGFSSHNLYYCLRDLCIWSDYMITQSVYMHTSFLVFKRNETWWELESPCGQLQKIRQTGSCLSESPAHSYVSIKAWDQHSYH